MAGVSVTNGIDSNELLSSDWLTMHVSLRLLLFLRSIVLGGNTCCKCDEKKNLLFYCSTLG